MEFQSVVRRRRMVRNYDDRPVPRDALQRILENALHAPSAGFSQGWGFLVLEDAEDRARFWDVEWPAEERHEQWMLSIMRAPVVIVPMSNKQAYLDRYALPDKGWTDRDEARWPVPFWDIDTGFASMLMLLTAVDLGLAALFSGLRKVDGFRAAFGVPEQYHPIGTITVGYAAPDVRSPSLRLGRKPVAEVVHFGRW